MKTTFIGFRNIDFYSILNSKSLIFDSSASVSIICESISQNINSSNDILVFNVEMFNDYYSITDGLCWDIIILLRCKYFIKNTICCLGFPSFSLAISINKKALICTSKNIKYLQHFNFSNRDLNIIDYDNSSMQLALKVIYDPKFSTHQQANWYGLKKLIDVHNTINESTKIEYPEPLQNSLNNIDNMIYLYLNTDQQQTLQTEVKQVQKELLEKRITEIENELQDRKVKGKHLLSNNLTLGQRVNYTKSVLEAKPNEDVKVQFEKELAQLMQIIDEKNNELKELKKQLQISNSIGIIETLKQENNEKRIKILNIDDQSEYGWGYVYQQMIYGKTTEKFFKSIEFTNNKIDKIESLLEQIKSVTKYNEQNQFTPNVILLDLILFPAKENKVTENLSGIQLIKDLNILFPFVPIIITSASSKIATYQLCINNGADAYWVKEGIESNFEEVDSIKNYYSLLELIDVFGNHEYEMLQQLNTDVNLIKENKLWWKQKTTWNNTNDVNILNESLPNTELIYNVLDSTIVLIKNFLQNKYIAKHDTLEWHSVSSIIQHLVKAIEIIHQLDKIGSKSNYIPASMVFGKRGDNKAKKLYEQRNKASHINTEVTQFTSTVLWLFINDFIDYLKIRN